MIKYLTDSARNISESVRIKTKKYFLFKFGHGLW